MPDPYFKRSVVLMVDHNDEGTFGFILNKPMNLSINDTLMDFPEFGVEVFMGGPVQPENLFFLHTLGEELGDVELIAPGLWWGGDFNKLKARIITGTLEPNQIRFFVGYAGWGEDQLAAEMREESWLISEPNVHDIFNTPSEDLWQESLRKMGNKHGILANFPEDPSFN